MPNTVSNKDNQAPNAAPQERKPNDSGVVHVEGFVKIYDPMTKKVYMEGRA